MVIVPLKGDILKTNVESYIILHWGMGFGGQWKKFLEDTIGDGIRFTKSNGEEVPRERADEHHSKIIKLNPPFVIPRCESLKYLYFLRVDGRLRETLSEALDALNNKKVKSVAFNDDRDRHPVSVARTGQIIRDWERQKIENNGRVFIEQVTLVCPEDYFQRYIPGADPLFKPVFRYSKDRLDRIQEKLDEVIEKLERL